MRCCKCLQGEPGLEGRPGRKGESGFQGYTGAKVSSQTTPYTLKFTWSPTAILVCPSGNKVIK